MSAARSSQEPTEVVAPVLDWLRSAAGRAAASDRLDRCGFPATASLVDEVIAESCLSHQWLIECGGHASATSNDPEQRGRRVVRDVVNDLSRPAHALRFGPGIQGFQIAEIGDDVDTHGSLIDCDVIDGVRALVDTGDPPPWLSAAVLAYLTLLADVEAAPEGVPAAITAEWSGSVRAAIRSRAWAALWAAGMTELFPEPCPDGTRRRRERLTGELLARIDELVVRHRLGVQQRAGHRDADGRLDGTDHRVDGDDG